MRLLRFKIPQAPVVPMEEVYIPKPEPQEPNISQFYSDPINFKQQTANAGGKNKWVAFILCLILGVYGAHKFYESKLGMGLIYFFTAGLFGIGWIVDCIVLLFKPNPYYV